jgi:hypothetical protein
MRLRLKIPGLPYPEPADQLRLKEALTNLAYARKLACRALSESMAAAGLEPSDEERNYINALFKLHALVMAQTGDIEAILRER